MTASAGMTPSGVVALASLKNLAYCACKNPNRIGWKDPTRAGVGFVTFALHLVMWRRTGRPAASVHSGEWMPTRATFDGDIALQNRARVPEMDGECDTRRPIRANPPHLSCDE